MGKLFDGLREHPIYLDDPDTIRAYDKYFDPTLIVPTELAVPMMPAEPAKQGMPPAELGDPAIRPQDKFSAQLLYH